MLTILLAMALLILFGASLRRFTAGGLPRAAQQSLRRPK